MDHAIETVCSKISFPFSDGLALEALRLLQQRLPRSASDRDDLESAGYCQVAAWMSIYALTNVQVGLSHGLGHQLGASTQSTVKSKVGFGRCCIGLHGTALHVASR